MPNQISKMSNRLAEIKTATLADAGDLAVLVNSAYRGDSSRQGWTTEADLLGGQRTDARALQDEIGQSDREILMLLHGGDLVGCVSLVRTNTEEAHLGMLTIRPTLQAAGWGRSLLAAAESRARAWGCRRINLQVIQKRDTLIAWYERRGYRATGVTEDFPHHDERFGLPKESDLKFRFFTKELATKPEDRAANRN